MFWTTHAATESRGAPAYTQNRHHPLCVLPLSLTSELWHTPFFDSPLQKDLSTAWGHCTKEDGQAAGTWRNNWDELSRPSVSGLKIKREKSQVFSEIFLSSSFLCWKQQELASILNHSSEKVRLPTKFVFQLFSRFRCDWRWYTAPVTTAGSLPFQ